MKISSHKPIDRIRLDDAITEIAQIANPGKTLRDAKVVVRQAFNYAERMGWITRAGADIDGRPLVNRRDFECWAAEKWTCLKARYQVPSVATMDVRLPSLVTNNIGVPIPADDRELAKQFVDLSESLILSKDKLAAQELELEQLRQQAAEREVKDAVTYQNKSKAGAAGGRGKRRKWD